MIGLHSICLESSFPGNDNPACFITLRIPYLSSVMEKSGVRSKRVCDVYERIMPEHGETFYDTCLEQGESASLITITMISNSADQVAEGLPRFT
jgi:hypothetical protein